MSALLLLVPALPLALAAALASRRLRPLAGALLPLAPVPALASILLAPGPLDLPWLMLGVRFGLDGWAPAFLAFTAALWFLASLAALAYHRDDPNRTSFHACFLLAMAGNLGLLVAEDAFSFYAFFATMSFAAYGLVVHARTPDAFAAGRVYIGFVVAGELALFAGLTLAVSAAGSPLLAEIRATALPWPVLALLLAGFGIKLGLVPLHLWLPLAHAAAPVAASAVLSGAMIKAGLFGILSFVPLGLAAQTGPGLALIVAGLASIPLAAILGGVAASPKAVLAWSSVGQMGLVALALGTGLAFPAAWPVLAPALVLFAAHHALAKGALFLGVGAVLADGRPIWSRATLAALVLPAAALAALPLTGGYAAKGALKTGLEGAPDLAPFLLPALAASSAATALLMTRLFLLLARQAPAPKPRILAAPFLATAALAALIVPFWPFAAAALPEATAFGELWLAAAGIGAAFLLDRLRRAEATAPQPVAEPAAQPVPAPARRRDASAQAVLVLRLVLRRLAGQVGRLLPTQHPKPASVVLVLAAMLALETCTHAPLLGDIGSAAELRAPPQHKALSPQPPELR